MGPANDNRRPFLSGIILAAGTSTRMGRAKQLLPLDNRPLLQHVVDATAASCLDEIILVLGHGAEEIRAAIPCPTRVRVEVSHRQIEGPGQREVREEAAKALGKLGLVFNDLEGDPFK